MAETKSAAVRKKAYHHGGLRSALLVAVKELIAEQGIESLSLRECARRAGVSWSAPGHHFGDKTGMLTAFAIEGFGELTAYMERCRDTKEAPAHRAAAVGSGYLEFALKNPEYFRVMFRAELLNEKDPEYQAANAGAFRVLKEAIAACEPPTGIPSDAETPCESTLPERCLLAWATVHGFAVLALEGALPQLGRSEKARLRAGRELIRLLGPALFPFRAWKSVHAASERVASTI